jgi:hypothetical protein
MECANCLEKSPLRPAHVVAAETLYNLERGIRPVVFGSEKAFKSKATKTKNKSIPLVLVFLISFSAFVPLFVHFTGLLKTSVTGQVTSSDGVMACNMYFHSSKGFSSYCETDAAGRFSTRLYGGVYRVVIVNRPGVPQAYQSISKTPLRVKAREGLTLRIVN